MGGTKTNKQRLIMSISDSDGFRQKTFRWCPPGRKRVPQRGKKECEQATRGRGRSAPPGAAAGSAGGGTTRASSEFRKPPPAQTARTSWT